MSTPFPSEFKSSDKLSLKCSAIGPSGASTVLIVVHGLGDHSQSLPYKLLAEFLADRDIVILRFDVRGHGESEGVRHHIDSWNDLRGDLALFVELARQYWPGRPIFLLGVSLGGLIVLDQSIHAADPHAGSIVLSPAVSTDGASRLVRILVPIFARLFPKRSIDPGLDIRNISRDRDAATSYTLDPLFSTRLTLKFAHEIMKATAVVRTKAPRIRAPLLMLHGSADVIVPPKASEDIFERVSSTIKSRKVYPGAMHNLLLEKNRDQVYSDIAEWLIGHRRL